MNTTLPTLAALTLTAALSVPLDAAAHGSSPTVVPKKALAQLSEVRRATARFHPLQAALDAQYGPLQDAAGIFCIADPVKGAMGIHYVNGALVVDGKVDAMQPEALIYEPSPNGKYRLVGVEYVVFKSQWDAANNKKPELFGQYFHEVGEGNRYGLPAFYALHVWLWEDNPSGLFADWNPNVRCP